METKLLLLRRGTDQMKSYSQKFMNNYHFNDHSIKTLSISSSSSSSSSSSLNINNYPRFYSSRSSSFFIREPHLVRSNIYNSISRRTQLVDPSLIKFNEYYKKSYSTSKQPSSPSSTEKDEGGSKSKEEEEQKVLIDQSFLTKNKNLISLVLFISTGLGLYVYFKDQKLKNQKNLERKQRRQNSKKSYGKVRIGGKFDLINAKDGKKFDENDLIGKFSLIYFGFTNCPDICPEELDKMCDVINRIKEDQKDEKDPIKIQPIFVSVDPNRDSKEAISNYLSDFDCCDELIGLTGSHDSIKQMCKSYRVYFSTPPNVKPGDDYLVDHSIFFYLMAPNGNFVDAFGKIFNQDQVYKKVKVYLKQWKDGKRFGEEEVLDVEDEED